MSVTMLRITYHRMIGSCYLYTPNRLPYPPIKGRQISSLNTICSLQSELKAEYHTAVIDWTAHAL